MWSQVYGGLTVAAGIFFTALGTGPAAAASCLDNLFVKHYGNLQDLTADPDYAACKRSLLPQRTQATPETRTAAALRAMARVPAKGEAPPASRLTITPLLRQDFSDIWLFASPGPVGQASGATLSYTSDTIAKNDSWALHGMAALVFGYAGDYNGVLGFNFAPYVTIDRLKNSSPKLVKSDTDTVTLGGSGEIGFDMLGGQHYFRGRGAAVMDEIADTTSGSAVLEWFPVYRDLNIGSPSAVPLPWPIIYRFSPELKARYDALPVPGSTTAKAYYWRYGPQATLVYQLLPDEPVPEFLRRFTGKTSVSWLQADDGRDYRWLEMSLTYNIDEDGHVGVTGLYKNGKLENTGANVDIYTLGLSAKW
jgi:hypothetical protein